MRGILKERGRNCEAFSKLSIVRLNQVIRPFTAKWHKISLDDGFRNVKTCKVFKQEFENLQFV